MSTISRKDWGESYTTASGWDDSVLTTSTTAKAINRAYQDMLANQKYMNYNQYPVYSVDQHGLIGYAQQADSGQCFTFGVDGTVSTNVQKKVEKKKDVRGLIAYYYNRK